MMAKEEITHFTCGPSSSKCKCQCPDGPCEHKWDGPWVDQDEGGSVTCSRCGMDVFSHDLWVT